ncbi:MAG: hypothetical protein ACREOG_23275, partial [Gemmatimonadaceae bacterium]
PRAGDTLRLKMEQTTEVEGTHGREKGAGASASKAPGDSTALERSGLRVYTRIAVEATDLDGADVTAITDSVRLTSSVRGSEALAAAARAAEGRRVRLHVAPDGATAVSPVEGTSIGPLRAVVTQMPATLPRDPVEVGQSWVRTMEIPVVPEAGGGGSAAVSGTFRLDSVSRGGDIAYVSLTGRLVRSTSLPYGGGANREKVGRRAATVSTSGSITGSIVIDRTRGWITDVRTTVVSRSLMQEGGAATASARMWMKISQRVQVY